MIVQADFARKRKLDVQAAFALADSIDLDPGQFDYACQLYRYVLTEDPNHVAAWTNLGALLYRIDDLEGAVRCWEQALLLSPTDGKAAYNLGVARFDKGDVAGAIQLFKITIEADPYFDQAWCNLAKCYQRLGAWTAARNAWVGYLRCDLDPQDRADAEANWRALPQD